MADKPKEVLKKSVDGSFFYIKKTDGKRNWCILKEAKQMAKRLSK